MKVIRGDVDTVRLHSIGVGNAFRRGGSIYMKIVLHHGGASAVNLETGQVGEFGLDEQVVPLAAAVSIESEGRVACGYNPK